MAVPRGAALAHIPAMEEIPTLAAPPGPAPGGQGVPSPRRAEDTYVLDPAWAKERQRQEAQGSLYDAATFRHLAALGVGPGHRCLELGAGTGSVACWLSERVGATGRVVAVDRDTRWLDALRRDNLEVRGADLTEAGTIEEGAYDLVCSRLLLMHLPRRQEVLRRMVRALRPGGCILVEDFDCFSAGVAHPPSEALDRAAVALGLTFQAAGANPWYGRELPGALDDAGAEDVEMEATVGVVRCGTPGAEVLALVIEHLGPRMEALRLLSREEASVAVSMARTPNGRMVYAPTMVAAWGRRPR